MSSPAARGGEQERRWTLAYGSDERTGKWGWGIVSDAALADEMRGNGYEVVEVVEASALAAAESELAEYRTLLTRFCQLAEDARGHYGIEECARPTQPDTEWDEIQEGLRDAAEATRAVLARHPERGEREQGAIERTTLTPPDPLSGGPDGG
jgi:hypothetical protein